MSKLFIFDFFGVLSGEIANRFCFNHFNKDIALKEKENYFSSADVGEKTFEDILKQMTKNLNINYNDILQEFKNYGKINQELFEYILKLKKKVIFRQPYYQMHQKIYINYCFLKLI